MFDMKLLQKYTPKNYKNQLKKIEPSIENINDIDEFIKDISTENLRVWIKIVDYTLADNINYIKESFALITLVIKLFAKELDVNEISLKNSEILKLLKRFSKSIKIEYAYRSNLIKHRIKKYTLLKDVKIDEKKKD
jgi:hypothetical protein